MTCADVENAYHTVQPIPIGHLYISEAAQSKNKNTLQTAVSHSSFYYVIWVWSHLRPVFKKTASDISKQAAMMFTISTVPIQAKHPTTVKR